MPTRTSSRVVPTTPPVPRGEVTAILLAAGFSSRMGRPKPLSRLGDKPLLAHSLDTLRATPVREIIVVLGSDAESIRRVVPLDGTRVILNPGFAEGMSSSIRAGLQAASERAEAFLIVLGDQPLVTAATITGLIARYQTTRGLAIVPTFRGRRGNPVLFDRSLLPEMQAIRGDIGCRAVLSAHTAEVVEFPVDDPGILLDVDTPQDLEALDAALRAGTPLERLLPP